MEVNELTWAPNTPPPCAHLPCLLHTLSTYARGGGLGTSAESVVWRLKGAPRAHHLPRQANKNDPVHGSVTRATRWLWIMFVRSIKQKLLRSATCCYRDNPGHRWQYFVPEMKSWSFYSSGKHLAIYSVDICPRVQTTDRGLNPLLIYPADNAVRFSDVQFVWRWVGVKRCLI